MFCPGGSRGSADGPSEEVSAGAARSRRAAGVRASCRARHNEHGRPIIVDRPLYRELVKTAIKRTHDELQAKAATAAEEKKATRARTAPADPITVAKRERDAQLRELTDQAHGANSDLGHALVHQLATVDPTDITVARFFVLCRRRHRTNYADRLTMRISRCRTGGTTTRLDVALPRYAAVALGARGRTDSGAPLMDRFPAGARFA